MYCDLATSKCANVRMCTNAPRRGSVLKIRIMHPLQKYRHVGICTRRGPLTGRCRSRRASRRHRCCTAGSPTSRPGGRSAARPGRGRRQRVLADDTALAAEPAQSRRGPSHRRGRREPQSPDVIARPVLVTAVRRRRRMMSGAAMSALPVTLMAAATRLLSVLFLFLAQEFRLAKK